MNRVPVTRLVAIALGVALCIASASAAWATVPNELTVQGKLTNPGGTPVTTAVTLIFRIFNAPAGGTDVWTAGVGEAHSVTPDADGLWTERIGTSTALTDAAFSGTDRWLEITVDDGPGGNPTETLPRTKLNTNPYTFRASTVDGATGGVVSGDLQVSGGNFELDLSTSTDGNILKSGTTFLHNRGTNNTFLGLSAGNLTMTGIENTVTGAQALMSNTSGGENTATGHEALRNNTSGFANTAIGASALTSNTTGPGNTAIGSSALVSNTTGSSNTATGLGALNRNTTGADNTACGSSALFQNTTGRFNTASGNSALLNNTIGEFNTASGSSALFNNTTGTENTASGYYVLYTNTTGDGNTASGVHSLYSNTSGSNNSANGRNTLYNNTTGAGNTASGRFALFNNTTGSGNTASGYNALNNNITGVNNTAIGAGANVSIDTLKNATALGAEAEVNASNKVRLGNTFVTVIEGQVAYTFTSDKHQKENFRAVDGDDVLRKIGDLELSSWNYKGQDPQQFRHYGPMAQEFFEAFGHDGVGTSGTPTTINSGDQAGILMIAMQAQQKQIEALKAQVVELQRLLVERHK